MLKNSAFFPKNYIKIYLGTRRKLFLQPESFCLLSKNDVENFFWKPLLKKNLHKRKMQFSRPAEESLPESRIFSSHSPKKNWNRKEIYRKQFASKCSHGHVEDIFDNSFEKKIDKMPKFFSLKNRKR